jgi:hypothetical protein
MFNILHITPTWERRLLVGISGIAAARRRRSSFTPQTWHSRAIARETLLEKSRFRYFLLRKLVALATMLVKHRSIYYASAINRRVLAGFASVLALALLRTAFL